MADAITDAELAEWERLPEWLRETYALHQTAGALERLIAAERERRSPAPVVKVTECVGRFVGEFEGQYVLDGDGQYRALADLMPDEAADGRIPPAEGPRGRFRITVEFWPEEP